MPNRLSAAPLILCLVLPLPLSTAVHRHAETHHDRDHGIVPLPALLWCVGSWCASPANRKDPGSICQGHITHFGLNSSVSVPPQRGSAPPADLAPSASSSPDRPLAAGNDAPAGRRAARAPLTSGLLTSGISFAPITNASILPRRHYRTSFRELNGFRGAWETRVRPGSVVECRVRAPSLRGASAIRQSESSSDFLIASLTLAMTKRDARFAWSRCPSDRDCARISMTTPRLAADDDLASDRKA